MDVQNKKSQATTILSYIAILVVGGFVIALFVKLGGLTSQEQQVPAQQIEKSDKTKTEKLLATDSSDPSHINNVRSIQAALEKYYNDYKKYPIDLNELAPLYIRRLPTYANNVNYFYAYWPNANPQAYHLGTLLGGRNELSPATLNQDADLNSEASGYTHGFNGSDPVFDLVGE